MDDISGQLNKILSDPNSMAQIQNIMSGLGLGGGETAEKNTIPPPAKAAPAENTSNIDMVGMMSQIAPLLGSLNQEDNSTRLLSALRPMLSEKRRDKITQAIRILQLMRLMPMLKESGMLSSILGGLF